MQNIGERKRGLNRPPYKRRYEDEKERKQGLWKDENGRLYRQAGSAREVKTDIITKRSRFWDCADKENENDAEGTLVYITVYGRKIPLSEVLNLANPHLGGGVIKITDLATGKKETTLNGQETAYPCRLFFSLDARGEAMKVFEFLGRRLGDDND